MLKSARISVLVCLVSLPALAGVFSKKPVEAKKTAVSALAAPAGLAASDVVGFWSLTDDFGLDYTETYESYFGSDGAFEVRVKASGGGDDFGLHGFGTWAIADGKLITTPSDRCKAVGAYPDACDDTSLDTLTVETVGGVKSLVNSDGDAVGEFAGAQKQFTLPDLFSTPILRPMAGHKAPSGPTLGFASRSEWSRRNGLAAFSDISGRVSGSRMAAGIRIGTAPRP